MFTNISIKARLTGSIVLSCVLLTAIGLIGLDQIRNSNASLESVYKDRLIPTEQLSEINAMQLDATRQLLLSGMHDPASESSKLHDHPIDRHLDAIKTNFDKMEVEWKAYMASKFSPEEEALARDYADKLRQFKEQAIDPAVEFFHKSQYLDGNRTILTKVNPLYVETERVYQKLSHLQLDIAKAEYEAAEAAYDRTVVQFFVLIVVGVALAAAIGYWMIRSLFAQLGGEPRLVSDISTASPRVI